MNIAVCDDLTQERERLKGYLRRLEKEENVEISITEFASGESLISYCEKNPFPDICFIDVYMEGMNGVECARELIARGCSSSIVFCTTSLDHALDGFRLKADGYLVKPYDYSDFTDAIWRCKKHFEQNRKCLCFVSDRFDYNVPFKEIAFIETDARCCVVHTLTEQIRTYKKIGDFEKQTEGEPSFLKIHRGCIVNMNTMASVSDSEIVFKNGERVFLPARSKKLQQQINDFFWKSTWSDGSDK